MTQTLATMLELAEADRDQALARVVQADERARRAQQQDDTLLAYRDDYRRRAPGQGGQSASIELLRCHQGFMERLDMAITQQRAERERLAAEVADQRQQLLAQEQRVAAVRKLMERRTLDQSRVMARQDQRHADENAQRASGAQHGLEPLGEY